MKRKLRIRLFAHSLVSDWNHGNAHFLRGLMRALGRLGHEVRSYEALGSWSLTNLVQSEKERSIEAIDEFRRIYHDLDIHFYNNDESLTPFLRDELRDVDVVIIHEWNDAHVVNTILSLKEECGFRALLHDTHHRAYTQPAEILRFELHRFDGVLAFGESLRHIYRDGFGIGRAWTFHEAAATDVFQPMERPKEIDVVWIGNWGDEERTQELAEFLIQPAATARGRRTVAYGVRYPEEAVAALAASGIEYRGYLPNLQVPGVYGGSALTLHIPRREYSNGLSGIPTIRIFEAMACGIPLISAPWPDAEGLFRAGEDYIVTADGEAMQAEIERLLDDDAARRQIAANSVKTITERHTCAHRAEQLSGILDELLA